jgi:hypothetical protein
MDGRAQSRLMACRSALLERHAGVRLIVYLMPADNSIGLKTR